MVSTPVPVVTVSPEAPPISVSLPDVPDRVSAEPDIDIKSEAVTLVALIPSSIERYSALEVIDIKVSLAFEPDPWAIVKSEKVRLPDRPKASVPSVKSVIVSASARVLPPSPTRRTIVSVPIPVVIVSAPVPPSSVSAPSPLIRISFPAPPFRVSLSFPLLPEVFP